MSLNTTTLSINPSSVLPANLPVERELPNAPEQQQLVSGLDNVKAEHTGISRESLSPPQPLDTLSKYYSEAKAVKQEKAARIIKTFIDFFEGKSTEIESIKKLTSDIGQFGDLEECKSYFSQSSKLLTELTTRFAQFFSTYSLYQVKNINILKECINALFQKSPLELVRLEFINQLILKGNEEKSDYKPEFSILIFKLLANLPPDPKTDENSIKQLTLKLFNGLLGFSEKVFPINPQLAFFCFAAIFEYKEKIQEKKNILHFFNILLDNALKTEKIDIFINALEITLKIHHEFGFEEQSDQVVSLCENCLKFNFDNTSKQAKNKYYTLLLTLLKELPDHSYTQENLHHTLLKLIKILEINDETEIIEKTLKALSLSLKKCYSKPFITTIVSEILFFFPYRLNDPKKIFILREFGLSILTDLINHPNFSNEPTGLEEYLTICIKSIALLLSSKEDHSVKVNGFSKILNALKILSDEHYHAFSCLEAALNNKPETASKLFLEKLAKIDLGLADFFLQKNDLEDIPPLEKNYLQWVFINDYLEKNEAVAIFKAFEIWKLASFNINGSLWLTSIVCSEKLFTVLSRNDEDQKTSRIALFILQRLEGCKKVFENITVAKDIISLNKSLINVIRSLLFKPSTFSLGKQLLDSAFKEKILSIAHVDRIIFSLLDEPLVQKESSGLFSHWSLNPTIIRSTEQSANFIELCKKYLENTKKEELISNAFNVIIIILKAKLIQNHRSKEAALDICNSIINFHKTHSTFAKDNPHWKETVTFILESNELLDLFSINKALGYLLNELFRLETTETFVKIWKAAKAIEKLAKVELQDFLFLFSGSKDLQMIELASSLLRTLNVKNIETFKKYVFDLKKHNSFQILKFLHQDFIFFIENNTTIQEEETYKITLDIYLFGSKWKNVKKAKVQSFFKFFENKLTAAKMPSLDASSEKNDINSESYIKLLHSTFLKSDRNDLNLFLNFLRHLKKYPKLISLMDLANDISHVFKSRNTHNNEQIKSIYLELIDYVLVLSENSEHDWNTPDSKSFIEAFVNLDSEFYNSVDASILQKKIRELLAIRNAILILPIYYIFSKKKPFDHVVFLDFLKAIDKKTARNAWLLINDLIRNNCLPANIPKEDLLFIINKIKSIVSVISKTATAVEQNHYVQIISKMQSLYDEQPLNVVPKEGVKNNFTHLDTSLLLNSLTTENFKIACEKTIHENKFEENIILKMVTVLEKTKNDSSLESFALVLKHLFGTQLKDRFTRVLLEKIASLPINFSVLKSVLESKIHEDLKFQFITSIIKIISLSLEYKHLFRILLLTKNSLGLEKFTNLKIFIKNTILDPFYNSFNNLLVSIINARGPIKIVTKKNKKEVKVLYDSDNSLSKYLSDLADLVPVFLNISPHDAHKLFHTTFTEIKAEKFSTVQAKGHLLDKIDENEIYYFGTNPSGAIYKVSSPAVKASVAHLRADIEVIFINEILKIKHADTEAFAFNRFKKFFEFISSTATLEMLDKFQQMLDVLSNKYFDPHESDQFKKLESLIEFLKKFLDIQVWPEKDNLYLKMMAFVIKFFTYKTSNAVTLDRMHKLGFLFLDMFTNSMYYKRLSKIHLALIANKLLAVQNEKLSKILMKNLEIK